MRMKSLPLRAARTYTGVNINNLGALSARYLREANALNLIQVAVHVDTEVRGRKTRADKARELSKLAAILFDSRRPWNTVPTTVLGPWENPLIGPPSSVFYMPFHVDTDVRASGELLLGWPRYNWAIREFRNRWD